MLSHRIICRSDGRLVSFFHCKLHAFVLSLTGNLQTAEIIILLYEATHGPQLPLQAPDLNPTGGVKGKPPVVLDFKQDPSRPGGGIFVAQRKIEELNNTSVIGQSDNEDGSSLRCQ